MTRRFSMIDEKKAQFEAAGATEFNFQDSWKFNVAAYRVDRLIGLQMVPVSVARPWKSERAAFTWWIDDVMMDEGKRLKDKLQPPNSRPWNEQMQTGQGLRSAHLQRRPEHGQPPDRQEPGGCGRSITPARSVRKTR